MSAAHSFLSSQTFRAIIDDLALHDRRHPTLISVPPTATIKETLAVMSRHQITSVPIRARSGSVKNSYTGLISTLDLVHYLFTHNHQHLNDPIEQVLPLLHNGREAYRIYERDLDDTLGESVSVLANGRHRILLSSVVSGQPSCVFTQSDLIRFIVLHINDVFTSNPTLDTCDLHTKFHNLISIDRLSDAKSAFLSLIKNNVSAIPVLDTDSMSILGVVSGSLLRGFSSSSLQSLGLPILEFIKSHFNNTLPETPTCTLDTSLLDVLKQLVSTDSHRVWVASSDNICIGVISYTDIISWLIRA